MHDEALEIGSIDEDECHKSEVEVFSGQIGTGADCWTGHKVLCCTQNAANNAVAKCGWAGTAPFCAGFRAKADCLGDQKRLTSSNYRAGGEQPCARGEKVSVSAHS